jgi:hypothetical protein
VVAAVVAGDADGFAAVYNQYATSLYACCHAVLPEPEAAGAVLDTFLIATVKLDRLRDPAAIRATSPSRWSTRSSHSPRPSLRLHPRLRR